MTELEQAYQLVFEDLLVNGPHLFQGIYDKEHGNVNFMYGIETVMEYIAFKADSTEKICDDFMTDFFNNLIGFNDYDCL